MATVRRVLSRGVYGRSFQNQKGYAKHLHEAILTACTIPHSCVPCQTPHCRYLTVRIGVRSSFRWQDQLCVAGKYYQLPAIVAAE